jgi:hypothetical protein
VLPGIRRGAPRLPALLSLVVVTLIDFIATFGQELRVTSHKKIGELMVLLSVTKTAPPRFNIGNPAPEGSTGSQWTESFCAKWFCPRASNIVDIDRSGSDRPVECCAIEFGWTTLKFV